MATAGARRPDPPPWYGKCGACGVKRTDPLADRCEACGEPYVLSNAPAGNPTQAPCKRCGDPVLWITMRKSGKQQPCNTKVVQIVTAEGETARGYVSHFATCTAKIR